MHDIDQVPLPPPPLARLLVGIETTTGAALVRTNHHINEEGGGVDRLCAREEAAADLFWRASDLFGCDAVGRNVGPKLRWYQGVLLAQETAGTGIVSRKRRRRW